LRCRAVRNELPSGTCPLVLKTFAAHLTTVRQLEAEYSE